MPADATTRFPFISLEKALGRANELYTADRASRPMPLATAFEVWGYSPKSSGAFQTVGALKGYGLLEDDGANDSRTVRLTSKAKNYFLDERDDHRKSLLATFALAPPLFRSLWEDSGWQLGIPADPIARSHLKIDRRLNEQSARSLLSIYRDNVQFAGLQHSLDDDDNDTYEELRDFQEEQADRPLVIGSGRIPMPSTSSGHRLTGGPIIAHMPAQSQLEARVVALKPIVFDMETVSGQYQFDNAEDLADFIEKLEKIKALLPSKVDID